MRFVLLVLTGIFVAACAQSPSPMQTALPASQNVATFTPTPLVIPTQPAQTEAPLLPTATATPPPVTATPIPGLEDAIANGIGFLNERYNAIYGLHNESPLVAPNTYWLTTDNWLALRALRAAGESERAAQVSEAIGDVRHGLIETLDGEMVVWPPIVETQTVVEERGNDKIQVEQRLSGNEYLDWQEYADLALYGALNAQNQNQHSEAQQRYDQTLEMFNGIGFEDKAYKAQDGHGFYATYKLALALYVGVQIGEPLDSRLLEALLAKQDDSGGFVTLYQTDGTPTGDSNTETTSHALLALTALRQIGR